MNHRIRKKYRATDAEDLPNLVLIMYFEGAFFLFMVEFGYKYVFQKLNLLNLPYCQESDREGLKGK